MLGLHNHKFYYYYKMKRTTGSRRRNSLESTVYTHEQNHTRNVSKVDSPLH